MASAILAGKGNKMKAILLIALALTLSAEIITVIDSKGTIKTYGVTQTGTTTTVHDYQDNSFKTIIH
jgi:hypothetical protein